MIGQIFSHYSHYRIFKKRGIGAVLLKWTAEVLVFVACLISLNLFGSQLAYSNAALSSFVEHTIATDLPGGYQVVVSDINHDGKPDLIALASGMKELIWFENPGWQRHVLISNISRAINCATWDIDADGIPEIALAHEFSNDP